ncbi:hypothetical protein BDV96DRAFT_24918 [Lophiotrema nucula]|uniref:Uncharacterized protein n=1 Tax=Lophiotrema nucula TaxID=690887 RepID=A0A6A5ZDS6_9PLEO|nr:hypothetical protein BDV96DRAFT_24918 [Lophiotrema nucula]
MSLVVSAVLMLSIAMRLIPLVPVTFSHRFFQTITIDAPIIKGCKFLSPVMIPLDNKVHHARVSCRSMAPAATSQNISTFIIPLIYSMPSRCPYHTEIPDIQVQDRNPGHTERVKPNGQPVIRYSVRLSVIRQLGEVLGAGQVFRQCVAKAGTTMVIGGVRHSRTS